MVEEEMENRFGLVGEKELFIRDEESRENGIFY